MKGTFYGIGVGPGDPELLTMKAVKAIQKVDIIIAPKTEKKAKEAIQSDKTVSKRNQTVGLN